MLTTRAKGESQTYPQPLIIPPLSTRHTSTMILLHGRGSNATTFSEPLLSTTIPGSNLTFAECLPTTKFIFPTSSYRRATFANRTPITQWFDNYTLDDADARPEYQIKGLRESIGFLHGLINDEVQKVGARNVFVGGLSQGACVAVLALLVWEGERLGGVFGMAGRIPLRHVLIAAMEDCERGEDEDEVGGGIVFEDESTWPDNTTGCDPPRVRAIQALREELDLGSSSNTSAVFETPIFLGHGTEDDKVPIQLGRYAVDCLTKMGCDVTWREYEGIGHWYSGPELEDILDFLRDKCSI